MRIFLMANKAVALVQKVGHELVATADALGLPHRVAATL